MCFLLSGLAATRLASVGFLPRFPLLALSHSSALPEFPSPSGYPLDIFRHFPLCVTVDGYFVCSVFLFFFAACLFLTACPSCFFGIFILIFCVVLCCFLFFVFCSLLAKSQPMSCGIFK